MFFRSYHFLYSVPDKRNYEPEFNFKLSYVSDFNTINVKEWNGYFKQTVRDDDLQYILYKARLGEIDTLIFAIKKPGYSMSNSLKNNSILKVSDNRIALDFLYYMGFAKRCEKYSTYEPDYWYDERPQPDTNDPRNDKAAMAALSDGALKQITNAKSDFVRKRYAFQILRLYYMAGDYNKCIQFYTTQKNLLESFSNSIFYRAEGYLAGAYFKQKQYSNANYLYSLIYDGYDTMKVTAYFSFHPQEEKDWSQTLALAKTPREKAVLWQLLGINADPLRAMQEIYALDPKSDLLDLLLARAVNEKEEKFIYQPGEYEGDDIAPKNVGIIGQDSVNKELTNFLTLVADKGNTTKPYEWNLAAGYIDWASGDKDFQKYLDKAKTQAAGDTLILDQVRLIGLLNMVNNAKAGDKSFEEKLVSEMEWLDGKHPADFRSKNALDFIQSNLTRKYAAIGDTIESVCLSGELSKNSKYFGNLLNNLIKFLEKENATPFEQYAARQLPFSIPDIYEMQSLKPLYQDHFKEGLDILNKSDETGLGATYADPFIIHLNDCHDCDFEDKKQKRYTKREFIERMIALEDSVKKDPSHVAKTYFLLANGCYNMTFYGNARVLYETKLTHVDDGYFEYHDHSDTSEIDNIRGLFNCSKAEEYYNKALAASNDREFKAQCAFMAAKCEQNEFYSSGGGGSGEFGGGKYFEMLETAYSKTKYYQEIVKECGYFKTYLKPQK